MKKIKRKTASIIVLIFIACICFISCENSKAASSRESFSSSLPLSMTDSVESTKSRSETADADVDNLINEAKQSIMRLKMPSTLCLNLMSAEDFSDIQLRYDTIQSLYQNFKNEISKRNDISLLGLKKVGSAVYSSDGRILYFFDSSDPGQKRFEIPEGAEVIFYGAFADEKALEEVTIPLSVKYVCCEAFARCQNLKKIEITANDPIGSSLIFGAVARPYKGGAATIDDLEALYERENQNIPEIVNTESDFVIEDGVLVRYNGLGGVVIIPEGTKEIKGGLFDHCLDNITKIVFPTSLSKVDAQFINGPMNRNIRLDFPDGVKNLPKNTVTEKLGRVNFLFITVVSDCTVDEGAIPDFKEDHETYVVKRD